VTAPKKIELDEFQQLAFTKAVGDRVETHRAAQTAEMTLRRLVSKVMAANQLTEKDWPTVGFEHLSMGILTFDPPTAPPEKKDEILPPQSAGPGNPPPADIESPPAAHAAADPTPAPAGPRLVPPAPPEVEWKSGESSEAPDTPEAIPPA
jgi:hypothetical protein